MKKLYSCVGIIALASTLCSAAPATEFSSRVRNISTSAVSPAERTELRAMSRAGEGMVITDLENQVQGRYSCEYYSPLIWEVTGEPFGWCIEQPMLVESYYAEEEGDVNIGYLFFLQGILQGHVDMANGTISIPSRKVITYYENDDDMEGKPVYFVTVDIEGNKYVANYDRPWTGTFELHDGKITKIASEERWGFVVQDKAGSEIGWFEIAEHTTWYRGQGEMEYYNDDLNGDGVIDAQDKEQTVVYAESDGNTATVYNAFRTGWNNPIKIELDNENKTATMREQTVNVNNSTLHLTDDSNATIFSGIIRDATWDVDKRDERANSVLDFGTMKAYDKAAFESLRTFGNVRFFFKDDVSVQTGVENITVSDSDAPATYYNLSGVRVSSDNLTPGIYILRQGNKTTKVIR